MPSTLPACWDACVDLTAANVDLGSQVPLRLVDEVAAAVQALPGARSVSVEVHDFAPASLNWMALYRPGTYVQPAGPEWDDLRTQVEQAVRGVTGVR